MRLHLWLETEEGLFFGIGRAQLLAKIDEYGSLKKAADELGMSYRAAWGKIRKTEKVLGLELVDRTGDRRGGYQLTEFGKEIQSKFNFWFNTIEKQALVLAQELFPWPIDAFEEKADD
jgi:molybdate transport system regulatory protein